MCRLLCLVVSCVVLACVPPADVEAPPPVLRDQGASPPDAAVADLAVPPAVDAGSPLDAGEPAPWQPAPAAWSGFPAHPFRPRVIELAAHALIATPDGQVLVAATADAIQVLDGGLRPRRRGATPFERAELLAVSADGRRILAARGRNAVVIDAADRDAPVEVARLAFDDPISAVALAADGARAWLATRTRGGGALHPIDLDVPAAPVREAAAALAGIEHVALLPGDAHAVIAHPPHLTVVDLSAGPPAVVGRLDEAVMDAWSTPLAVARDGQTAWYADGAGTRVIDLRTPTAPRIVATLDHAPRRCPPLPLDDGLALVHGGVLHLLDATDPALVRARVTLPQDTCAIAAPSPHHLLIATPEGLMRLDRRALTPPVFERGATPAGELRAVRLAADGRHAWVGGSAVHAIDLRDPTAEAGAVLDEGGWLSGKIHLAPDGETVYLAGDSQLTVIDARDPRAPTVRGRFEQTAQTAAPMDMVAPSAGGLLFYVSEGGGGFSVLDVRDPAAIEVLAHHYIRHTRSVLLMPGERIVYVGDPYEQGLVIFDVSDPTAPTRVEHPIRWPVTEQALSPDGALLAALGDGQFGDSAGILLDVREPASPREVGAFETGQLSAVRFGPDADTLWVGDGRRGLRLVDVRDPAAPRLVGRFDVGGEVVDFAVTATGRVISLAQGARVRLFETGAAPTLEPVPARPAGVWRYRLRWTDLDPAAPEAIAWHASSGSVVVHAVDQAGATALIDWRPGAEKGRLSVAVGNYHHYRLAEASAP